MIPEHFRTKSTAVACVLVLLVGSSIVVRAAGQEPSAQGGGGAKPTSEAALRTTYVLGSGDQVTIHVVDLPDISDKPERIDPSGNLRLPVVGRVHAAGMTLEQLETELRDRLKSILKEPDVTVTVPEFHSQSVSVVGAVASPGVRPLEGSKTLIEILSISGGPSADAGPVVRISRRLDQGRIPLPEAVTDVETGFSTVDIPLRPLLDTNTPEKNVFIRPNDIVSVPKAEVVYVIGEVGHVGPVPVMHGKTISVVEAISASGGVLKTGKSGGAKILRQSAGSQARTEIPVDVGKIMQGQKNDVQLFVGDILVVPENKGRRALIRALEIGISIGVIVGVDAIIN